MPRIYFADQIWFLIARLSFQIILIYLPLWLKHSVVKHSFLLLVFFLIILPRKPWSDRAPKAAAMILNLTMADNGASLTVWCLSKYGSYAIKYGWDQQLHPTSPFLFYFILFFSSILATKYEVFHILSSSLMVFLFYLQNVKFYF